jgi:hypothetical protein
MRQLLIFEQFTHRVPVIQSLYWQPDAKDLTTPYSNSKPRYYRKVENQRATTGVESIKIFSVINADQKFVRGHVTIFKSIVAVSMAYNAPLTTSRVPCRLMPATKESSQDGGRQSGNNLILT